MKRLTLLFFLGLICSKAIARNEKFIPGEIVNAHWRAHADLPLETFSPILGSELLDFIFQSKTSPEDTFKSLENTVLVRDMYLNSIQYNGMVLNGLNEFCSQKGPLVTRDVEENEITHFAALPMREFTDKILVKGQLLKRNASGFDTETLKLLANQVATEVDVQRQNCDVVTARLSLVSQFLRASCYAMTSSIVTLGSVSRCEKFVNKNLDIVSFEASYPRTQFSINGFTRYFIHEVLKVNNLEYYLKSIYEAATKVAASTDPNVDLWAEVSRLIQDKRVAILLLSGLGRNMPSLEVMYGLNYRTALLVETYFWKLRQVVKEIAKKNPGALYPDRAFEGRRAPGMYHYYTAALQSCDLIKDGFDLDLSLSAPILQKIAYKSHKFIGGRKGLSLSDSIELAKKQGFQSGIMAGVEGGLHGVEECRSHSKIENIRLAIDPYFTEIKRIRDKTRHGDAP